MSQAFKRNLRYQGRCALITLGYTALTVVGMVIWVSLSTPMEYLAENLAVLCLGSLLFAAFLWSASVYMTMYTITMPMVLTYSTTRKASFWGCQAGKVLYAAGTGVLGLICAGAARIFWPELGNVGLVVALLAVFIVLFFASLMELAGMIFRRFGKWGFVIYAVLCGVLGMAVGIGVAMSDERLSDYLVHFFDTISGGAMLALSCSVMLLLAIISTAIAGMFYHKMSV